MSKMTPFFNFQLLNNFIVFRRVFTLKTLWRMYMVWQNNGRILTCVKLPTLAVYCRH